VIFEHPPPEVARRLIGAILTVDGDGGIIVETEAYDIDDPASHSYRGATARNAPMFGPAGRAYVYRSYGLHWCLNIVCGSRPGGAVLLRALEPTLGVERMIDRRGLMDVRRLAAGPGRLCQALGVDAAHNGLPIQAPPFGLDLGASLPAVAAGPRIGITKAAEQPWRFGLPGSPYLSRPFKTISDPA
jgi:DNA-3-methyladenine glycosylase